MSTRKDSRKKVSQANQQVTTRKYELPRPQLVEIYRQNAMRTLREVRKGMVNEVDIDKLQNFVQVSLALMEIVSVDTFRQAQRNAELLGFFKGGDASVVLDPKKQRPDIELNLDIGAIIEEAVLQMADVEVVPSPSLGEMLAVVKQAVTERKLANSMSNAEVDAITDIPAYAAALLEEDK